MSLAVGDVFAGYTILRQLGAGGMGEVYLAQHPRLPRTDAIKVLPTSLTTDPDFRARFVREADLAAGLWHPHIVGVHDRGEFEGQLWLTMDYVEGVDAHRLLEQHPHGVPLSDVVEMVTAVADALDYAHHRGLLHRDVKPGNILLAETANKRRTLLADFGIARQMDDFGGLTATNMAVGSMAYAAPEQLSGAQLDGRADQYALACTAFHLLTGSVLFADSNPAVVIGKHLTAPAPPISERRPDLASANRVFATALAKDPQERFPTCTAFAAALARETGVGLSQAATAHAIATAPPLPTASSAQHPAARRKWGLPAAVGAGLAVAVGAVAVVAFSGGTDQPSAVEASEPALAPSPVGAVPVPAADPPAPGQPVVIIDGQNQYVTGELTCVTYQGETYLTIEGGATISVALRAGDPPVVTIIGMDRVNGHSLSYVEGGDGNAQAVRDGSTYRVTGTLTGTEVENPKEMVTRSVEITAVCP